MKTIKSLFRVTVLAVLFCAVLVSCGSAPEEVTDPVPTDETAAVPVQAVQVVSQIDELDGTIREASTYLNGRIPKGNKVVFLNIQSNYPDLSEYILSILSENAVNDGVFSVVDRQQLDQIRAELNFQMSGEVSDESAQNIGRMLGAEGIISGAINKIGPLYRVQVKAIEVETAGVQGQWSKNIPESGTTLAALTERFVPASVGGTISLVQPRRQTQASTAQPPAVPATVVAESSIPAQQVPHQVSEADLIGVWKGTYNNGEAALILTIYEERGAYLAIFDFFNLPGRSNMREGRYYMQVNYDRAREKFYLKATEWIDRPSGYGFVNLDGIITGNVFSGFHTGSNSKFSVTKQE